MPPAALVDGSKPADLDEGAACLAWGEMARAARAAEGGAKWEEGGAAPEVPGATVGRLSSAKVALGGG